MAKKKVLWVGDAVASTGFARSTHKICDVLHETYDVHVLGINYYGDPHPYPYPIYPAISGGDAMGHRRMRRMVAALKPDVIVIQNDPWNVMGYLEDEDGSTVGDIPVIGYIAIDGKNCRGAELNRLALAVFWTEFAESEARKCGCTVPTAVIPLGVDLDMYQPQPRAAVRERMQMVKVFADRGMPEDSFVVGVVGRNQWRKRLDLTIEYFAEWIHSRGIQDAALWMHSAPTLDSAWDLDDLARYYGVSQRVLIPEIPKNLTGFDEGMMARCYGMFDVLFSTTLGEGFWLPGFEAAACGTPIIAPDWSAVGELFKDAALLVPCLSTAVHPSQTNTIGGVMDRALAIDALDTLYRDKAARTRLGVDALARASEERFQWPVIGERFRQVLDAAIGAESNETAWQDLVRPEVAHAV